MATTPEGAVKKMVREVLTARRVALTKVWWYMPVQNGMGTPVLDFIGAAFGKAFAIETKAPGKHPTDRQQGTINDMQRAGIRVFVISNDKGCVELEAWINGLID